MNFIGGSDSFRYFKIISVNNKKVKDEGRYKTKGSPGDAAKKAFTQLSKKYKKNKLIFSIKETTQGSSKKEHGPYLGEKIKLKKPLEVKYKGKNKPVLIKYETKIHLVKDHKQKGGITIQELQDKIKRRQQTIQELNILSINKSSQNYELRIAEIHSEISHLQNMITIQELQDKIKRRQQTIQELNILSINKSSQNYELRIAEIHSEISHLQSMIRNIRNEEQLSQALEISKMENVRRIQEENIINNEDTRRLRDEYDEKISTLRMLTDEGYNTKLLEEEIAKIKNELLLGKKYTNRNNEEARLLRDGIEGSMSSAGGPVANDRNLKLFFFDLDETLTSRVYENRNSLGFIELATNGVSWIYTTNEVIQVLTEIHDDPNSRWYVISSGGNSDVLDMLCLRLGFQANASVFNIQNKSVPILQIMEGLKNEGYILDKITFIDDTPDKIEEVKSSIPSMTTIQVESYIGEFPNNISDVPEHMIDMFMKKIIQQSEMQQILDI